MKVKTSDLIGPALDWAVAKCERLLEGDVFGRGCVKDTGFYKKNKHGGFEPMLLQSAHDKWVRQCETYPWSKNQVIWRPSVDWSQGGPIIGREHISVDNRKGDPCRAFKGTPAHYEFSMFAPEGQPLIAAMRCFVASRLGDEVDIPEELLK